MKKLCFILLIFLHWSTNCIGQLQYSQCGTDGIHNYLFQHDSLYRLRCINYEQQIKNLVQNQSIQNLLPSVYTIPVVVHVIHNGEPIGTGSNISDSQIQNAIQGLNSRFANSNGNGINIEIEFCLAERDPNGNISTGINRVDGSGIPLYSTGGIKRPNDTFCNNTAAEDTTIKNLIRWPITDYYNIWVVRDICGGWAGYAYYPSIFNNFDGAVIDRNYMTNSSTTLSHEIGHGLFLYHTFEGDGGNLNCPTDTSCLDNGDKVCDTPPHTQGNCTSTNACAIGGTWNNSRFNYMSYCSSDRFTSGQKSRMRAAAVVAPRISLLNSLGCSPVLGEDAGITEIVYPIKSSYTTDCSSPIPIGPVVKLRNFGIDTLTSVTINYQFDYNTPLVHIWFGSLETGATIEVSLPPVQISTGNHTFLAYTTNPNGLVDGYSSNDSANVLFDYIAKFPFNLSCFNENVSCFNGSDGMSTVDIQQNIELIEDFEGNTDWTIVNGSQFNLWHIGSDISNGGANSIYISNDSNNNSYSNNISSVVHFYKDFYFPIGATNIIIKFNYRGVGENGQDFLKVFLLPTSVTPAPGYQLTTGQIGGTYSLQPVFDTLEITGLNANSGLTRRLVFSWRNNSSSGGQPPAAIDNICISYTLTDSIPYNYQWNTIPPQYTSTVTNLLAGTYVVMVNDTNGCIDSLEATIFQPSEIILATNSLNVTCNGFNDGSASVVATGGTLLETVHLTENWESTNSWTIINGSQVNKWHIGSAVSSSGFKSIYVSNNSNSNYYNILSSSCVHFYKDFIFPMDAQNIKIKFDWKGNGESIWDYLRVYLIPTTVVPIAGSPVALGQIGNSYYNLQTTYVTDSIIGLDSIAGTARRLVFTWKNDATFGTQPPASIDNIIISYDTIGNGNYNYLWNTIPPQFSDTAINLPFGTYNVTVTDGNLCTATSVVNVSQPSSVSVFITPTGPTTFCVGDSVVLNCSLAETYIWSNGDTSQSITVFVTGNYYVTVTDSNGCTGVSSIMNISVNQLPTANITLSGATTFCQGDSVTLSASGGTSYIWSNSQITQNISVNQTGNYFVIAYSSCGIDTSSIIQVLVNPLPNPLIYPSGSTAFCQGDSINLATMISSGYLWSNGDTTQDITVSTSGNYYVIVTDLNGCSGVSPLTGVSVYPLPVANISANGPTTFCQGDSVLLTSSNADNYLWNNGFSTQSIMVLLPGNYYVVVTDSNLCSSTSIPINVLVNIPQNGLDNTYSNDTMSAPYNSPIYWYIMGITAPVDSGQIIICNQSGIYYSTGMDINGCYAVSDTISINCLSTSTIDELDFSKIQVFPNPFSNRIIVSGSGLTNETYRITLLGTTGQIIERSDIIVTDKNIFKALDTTLLLSGIYTILVESHSVRIINKLVKLEIN